MILCLVDAAVWHLSNCLPPEPRIPRDVSTARWHPPEALAVMLTLGNKEPGPLRLSVLHRGQCGKRNSQQKLVLRSRNR